MTQDASSTVVHGIDFGTSTSMIVVGRPGVAQLVIKDPLAVRGEVGIPTSVCARPDGTLAVGFEAERIKQIHVADYRTGFKLDMGKPVVYHLGGADYSPADLMAKVIEFLRASALAVVPAEPSAVVLTVPVSWEDWTRDQAIGACATAGYDLSLIRLETEPVAAMAGLGPLAGTTVICDLGGGTFDCAVVLETDGGQEIYGPPGGLRHVGGRAFDDRVVRLVRDRFPQAGKIFAPDVVPGDPTRAGGPEPGAASAVIDLLRRRIQLREKCVEAKVELSLIQSTEKLLSELDPPELLTLSRTELNDAISDLVEETVGECERMLNAADLSFGGVDQILQIGGSSRIPLSGERLRARSGRPVRLVEEPDLAVARGATQLALEITLPPEPEFEPEPATSPAVMLPSTVVPAEPQRPAVRQHQEFLQAVDNQLRSAIARQRDAADAAVRAVEAMVDGTARPANFYGQDLTSRLQVVADATKAEMAAAIADEARRYGQAQLAASAQRELALLLAPPPITIVADTPTGIGKGVAMGAGAGLAAGTVVPVLGHAVGLISGAVVGGFRAKSRRERRISALRADIREVGSTAVTAMCGSIDAIIALIERAYPRPVAPSGPDQVQ
jgi:molecular chaperone DnaK